MKSYLNASLVTLPFLATLWGCGGEQPSIGDPASSAFETEEQIMLEILGRNDPARDLATLEWLLSDVGVNPNATAHYGEAGREKTIAAIFLPMGIRIVGGKEIAFQPTLAIDYAEALAWSSVESLDLAATVDLDGQKTPLEIFNRDEFQKAIRDDRERLRWRDLLQISVRGIKYPYWVCTATALDDSSVFFWDMGNSRSEAYKKALARCSRAGRKCDISCELVS